jgi:hypothetical protein
MKPRWFRWWWFLLLIPLIAGATRLRFDVEVLDLLAAADPAVAGLKVYQEHFSSSRELIITVEARDADTAETAAADIARQLRHHGSLFQARRAVGRALLLCGGTAIAGFGSLGLSSNAGMASLGRVCAVGIAGNVLLSVLALPVWWKAACGAPGHGFAPSQLYRGTLWRIGLFLGRRLPPRVAAWLAGLAAGLSWIIYAPSLAKPPPRVPRASCSDSSP